MLLVPKASGVDALVWVLPVVVLVVSAAGLVVAFGRWRREAAAAGAPTAADRELVALALREDDGLVGRRTMTAARADVDRLAELEDERRFLLVSLKDLEREHEAGDVDDDDYQTLKDGYTARAAAVLRAIDQGRRALPPRRPPRWGRIAAVTAAVAALAIGAGLLVARFAGQRLPGQTISGGVAEDTNSQLAQARALLGTDPLRSLAALPGGEGGRPRQRRGHHLLGMAPGHPGRRAWGTRTWSSSPRGCWTTPSGSIRSAPTPTASRPSSGSGSSNDAVTARQALDRCMALDPPAEVASLLTGLSAEIDAAPGRRGVDVLVALERVATGHC